MCKRLACWKRNYISKGGRVILIKSTLVSLPLYQMSMIIMPILVAKRLEKLQRNFLWGGGALEKKPHLVKWDVVCTRKEQGGLGLRNLTIMNKGLLGKWIGRFALRPDACWKRLICFKYGKADLGWSSKKAHGPYGIGLWKDILKEFSWVKDHWKFSIGNGFRVRF